MGISLCLGDYSPQGNWNSFDGNGFSFRSQILSQYLSQGKETNSRIAGNRTTPASVNQGQQPPLKVIWAQGWLLTIVEAQGDYTVFDIN